MNNRSLILSILVFVCVGICIYKGRKFAGAQPSERTTTARVVLVQHSIFRRLRFDYYSCSYNFNVDGSLYLALGDCPQWIADYAVKGVHLGPTANWSGTDATVYYDPADPSVNSLLEFSTASQVEYRAAVPWIGLSALIILCLAFAKLLTINEKTGKGRVIVDAAGTVVCPEDFELGSRPTGLPRGEAAGCASEPGLRELYLEVVNKIHPDRAVNETDLALRDRLMKEANTAFERGDSETLRQVLKQYSGQAPTS